MCPKTSDRRVRIRLLIFKSAALSNAVSADPLELGDRCEVGRKQQGISS